MCGAGRSPTMAAVIHLQEESPWPPPAAGALRRSMCSTSTSPACRCTATARAGARRPIRPSWTGARSCCSACRPMWWGCKSCGTAVRWSAWWSAPGCRLNTTWWRPRTPPVSALCARRWCARAGCAASPTGWPSFRRPCVCRRVATTRRRPILRWRLMGFRGRCCSSASSPTPRRRRCGCMCAISNRRRPPRWPAKAGSKANARCTRHTRAPWGRRCPPFAAPPRPPRCAGW